MDSPYEFLKLVMLNEEQRCKIFDSGVFNTIAMAYTALALRHCEFSEKVVAKVLHGLQEEFEFTDAQSALERLRETNPNE